MRFDLTDHTTVEGDLGESHDDLRVYIEPCTDDRPADSIRVVTEATGVVADSLVISTSELQQAIGFCKDAANAVARRVAAD